ncbi:hypothetical protein [Streptomyces sp. NPDC005776]|uniref:hypothetical protein n=1 Tax=unclassified Streptomyces TaxID=2593676 RepID=UPI0033DC34E9
MSLQMVRSRTGNDIAARTAPVEDVVRTVCSSEPGQGSVPERFLAAGAYGS